MAMCDYAVDIRETHVATVREAVSWSAIYLTKRSIRPFLYLADYLGDRARAIASTHGSAAALAPIVAICVARQQDS